jgi:hypothetical protein
MKAKYLTWLIRELLSPRNTEISIGGLHKNAVCDLFIPLTSATRVRLEVLIHSGQGKNKSIQNYYWSWNRKRFYNKYIHIKSLSRTQTLLKGLMVLFHGCISHYVLNHIFIVTLFTLERQLCPKHAKLLLHCVLYQSPPTYEYIGTAVNMANYIN